MPGPTAKYHFCPHSIRIRIMTESCLQRQEHYWDFIHIPIEQGLSLTHNTVLDVVGSLSLFH